METEFAKHELPGGAWLEPAAGDGALIKTTNEFRAREGLVPVEWSACELRPECEPLLSPLIKPPGGVFIGDFLLAPSPGRFAVSITNPPFSIAWEFAAKSREMADWTILLLRLNFFGTAKRHAWIANNMPDVFILPDRPSFRGDGKTDSIEYAWFVWGPESHGRTESRVQMLALTPKAIRKPPRPRAKRRLKAQAAQEPSLSDKAPESLSAGVDPAVPAVPQLGQLRDEAGRPFTHECDQCGVKGIPMAPDDLRCVNHAHPISSCDGTMLPWTQPASVPVAAAHDAQSPDVAREGSQALE